LALAIFDLDETLISADSDHAWGVFVADRGLVDAASHRATNEAFYNDYKRGDLDIFAYLRFACSVLKDHSMDSLEILRAEFFEERIRPLILPKAQALVERHRREGDSLLIVTATLEFVTAPIARYFDIPHLIAPIPEVRDGRYTGEIVGIPSFRDGKVLRTKAWLKAQKLSLYGSYFYTDSRNDLPLLEVVDFPTAVDPDPELRRIATERKWPIISLRD
jgi:HAD superfamily hydrolase (TIGR01490 family)